MIGIGVDKRIAPNLCFLLSRFRGAMRRPESGTARGDSSMHEHFVIADKPLVYGQQGNSSRHYCHPRYDLRLRHVPFSPGRRAGYKDIDSSGHKLLRKSFLARNKRDLVAATEMPASSATSFNERSLD
jgi:hypothetical protein